MTVEEQLLRAGFTEEHLRLLKASALDTHYDRQCSQFVQKLLTERLLTDPIK